MSRAICACMTGILAWACLVAGQPPVEQLAELDELERRAADGQATAEARAAAADAAIDLRRRLLDAAGDDPRRITWIIDQGVAMLARLGADASDTGVLFGLPTDDQRRRVGAAAGEVTGLLDAAHEHATSVTDEQTRLSLREGGTGAEASPLLTALRDEQVRGQLVRGRAALLAGALADEAGHRGERAQAAIDALSGIGFEEAAGEASRRVSLGAALVLRGEAGDGSAAVQHFVWALGDGRGRPGVLPATVAEAMLGRLQAVDDAALDGVIRELGRTRHLPPRTVRGEPDSLWHLIFADAIARTQVERWRARPDPGRLASAFAVYDGLDSTGSIGLTGEELRAVVLIRRDALSRWGGEIDAASLPPQGAFARAIMLARDPARRTEAEEALDALAGRADAGPIRADALWELGVLTGAADDRLRSVEVTIRFARDHAADPRAEQAIAYAVHYARTAMDGGDSGDRARRALADALRLATSSFTHLPEINRWRIARARLLLSPPEPDRAAALALLEAVPASSGEAAEAAALYEEVQGGFLDATRARMLDAFRRGDEGEVRRQGAQLAAESRRAIDWARPRGRPTLDRYRVDLADALLETGDASVAAGMYGELLDRAAAVPGGSARVQLGLGRARSESGDGPGAFGALRDLVTPLDALPPAAPRPEEYWHAWALMLEILAHSDSAGRAGAIRVHTQRLSTIDAAWGGEPWRTRIQKVLDGLPAAGGR